MASRWENVSAFAFSIEDKTQAESTGGLKKSALVREFVKDDVFLTPGTCDTAGPIEIEGSIVGTTPTAYATLKTAFDAINAGTHTGSISIDVCGNSTETATAALNSGTVAPASYTDVTIRPVGAARIIEGSIVGAIIKLNGADNVTIDGRQGGSGTARDLTVRNNSTSTETAAIWLASVGAGNGASNNTVRNLEIAAGADQQASTNTTFGIIMCGTAISTTTNGVDNDNNSFIANRVVKARYGITTRGTTTNLNINPVVTDNILGPASFGADQIGTAGIFMQADTGATVSRNIVQFVGGLFANSATGTDRCGICIGSDSWAQNATTLTSNTYTVTKNNIHDIIDEKTFSSLGIQLATTGGGSATNNVVANNFIYNVRANGTSTDQPVGIGIAGGHTDKVVFTSISMTGDMDPAGATASAIYGNAMRVSQQPATHANLTLMNNSIYLDVNSNTAANLFYAITLPSATYAFGTGGLDYNNYYINPANTQLRTGGVGVTSGNTPGTSFQTLANWQAALTLAQDANSKQADPLYVSNTSNLHIQSASPNESMGTSITGVTDDIDSDARGATPDIGADEIVAAIPGTVQFASATYSVGEGGGSVALSVTRTGGSSGAISVGYSFFAFGPNAASGAASCGAGIDFAAVSGTLNWADGDSAAKTINVTICEDALFEGDETFYTQLQTPTGGAVIGAQNSTLVTITDNDAQPSLQFGFAAYGAGEGGGNAIISVTRTGTTGNAVSVNYATVAGGSATGGASSVAGVDYQNTSGTLNFAAGVTSQTFNVPICDDALTEPNETVNLALSTPGGGAVLGAQNTAVLTITDNDADTIAPVITYTLIPTNSFNPTLNATITDTVGVTGATIFWRINGGGYTSAGCSLSGGTAQSGTWSCQITGMANPNAVSYYVTATDAAANTATKPTGGASAPNLFTFGAATVPAGTYANMSLGNGAFLGGNVVVNGSLTINGVINTGANTLTLECGVSITGGGEFNYIVGKLERRFCGVETFTFPVGAAFALPPVAPDAETLAPEGGVSNYSPLTVTVTSGNVGSSLTVSVTDAFMDGAVQVNSISRYWTLTENGNLTANLAFTYRNEDVVGNESSWNVLRRESGSTSNYPGGTVNGATNTFNAPNVSNFSQWSAGVAVPTAASAEISGRLTTASGEGIRNATVMLTGGNLTQPAYVQTGTFGNYRFGDLPVGQIYVVTVISKRYTFANPSRVINLTDSVTGEDFAAEEQ